MVKILGPLSSAASFPVAIIVTVFCFALCLLAEAILILRPIFIHRVRFILGKAHLVVTCFDGRALQKVHITVDESLNVMEELIKKATVVVLEVYRCVLAVHNFCFLYLLAVPVCLRRVISMA